MIPSWNTRELLRVCLETIEAAEKPTTEVIVVENGSEDGSGDMVATHFPSVRLLRNAKNEGFAKGCNRGIRAASGNYVLLQNTDTEIYPDALSRMLTFLDGHPEYGAAAPRLVNSDGSTQGGCMAFPNWRTPLFFGTPLQRVMPDSHELRRYFLRDFDHDHDCDVDQPPAASLLVRASALDEIGLFDENLWLYFNDVDLSLRLAKAGYKTRFVADARVMHHVGASTRKFEGMRTQWQKNRLYYYRKHFGRTAGVWVKACVLSTYAELASRQLWRRVRGRDGLGSMRDSWNELTDYLRS